jgi:hypothetical protein
MRVTVGFKVNHLRTVQFIDSNSEMVHLKTNRHPHAGEDFRTQWLLEAIEDSRELFGRGISLRLIVDEYDRIAAWHKEQEAYLIDFGC